MADPISFELSLGNLVFSLRRWGSRRVFVIHGHDYAIRDEVTRFLLELGLDPVVLDEGAGGGRTIIEKFEHNSRGVSFAVGLLTSDDIGHPLTSPHQAAPRARQNVIFELGFFVGRLGRRRVVAILDDGVELPSDYQGVTYIRRTNATDWRIRLVQELDAAGLPVKHAWEALLRSVTPRATHAHLPMATHAP